MVGKWVGMLGGGGVESCENEEGRLRILPNRFRIL